jgi:hypothetical protein
MTPRLAPMACVNPGKGSLRDRLRSTVLWGSVVLCAAACSRGNGASSGGVGLLGGSTGTDLLIEGTGLETLRIDEATVADAADRLRLAPAEWTRTFDNGLVEMRTPQLLRLSFLPPESGQGPPRLYAVRAGLWEPVYTGKTSKGIGFLDSLPPCRTPRCADEASTSVMRRLTSVTHASSRSCSSLAPRLQTRCPATAARALGVSWSASLGTRVGVSYVALPYMGSASVRNSRVETTSAASPALRCRCAAVAWWTWNSSRSWASGESSATTRWRGRTPRPEFDRDRVVPREGTPVVPGAESSRCAIGTNAWA